MARTNITPALDLQGYTYGTDIIADLHGGCKLDNYRKMNVST